MAVELWTDGACSGNPGPGGWACVLRFDGVEKELSDGEAESTNNRMELLAVIRGLQALTRPVEVVVHLDSTYVMNAFTKDWVGGWQRNGWKNSAKKPVANRELWLELIAEKERHHHVKFTKVKGHSGVELNDRVDRLAVEACRRYGGTQRP
jgi:ribonuclease HI